MGINIRAFISGEALKTSIPELFKRYDSDSNNEIDKDEFYNLVEGCAAGLFKLAVTKKRTDKIFNKFFDGKNITMDSIYAVAKKYRISIFNENSTINELIDGNEDKIKIS